MNLKHLVILATPLLFGLGACSSTKTEETPTAAAQTGGQYSLREKNPFEWSADDVKAGANGTFSGGKRSEFDRKKTAAYSKNRKAPGYLSRAYHSSAWNGKKDYSTGSFSSGKKPRESGRRSWFGRKKSRNSGKIAHGSQQGYKTNGYTANSARESGRTVARRSDAYIERRRRIGGKRPLTIISKEGYRDISMDQSRVLLGK